MLVAPYGPVVCYCSHMNLHRAIARPILRGLLLGLALSVLILAGNCGMIPGQTIFVLNWA